MGIKYGSTGELVADVVNCIKTDSEMEGAT